MPDGSMKASRMFLLPMQSGPSLCSFSSLATALLGDQAPLSLCASAPFVKHFEI